jgi:16S rRNA (adenine1518-N6/adenine1519-N6)-dimethyltransferase
MKTNKHSPKKSLGQNFLVDENVAQRIIGAADITKDDTVFEIGPGRGVLTRGLAEQAGRVVAIELDERLIDGLRNEHADLSNLDVVHADALSYDFANIEGRIKVVANLPYYISTPIISRLVGLRTKVSLMVLMLQKEVAGRIAAPPGGKEYGYLSVMVQLYTSPEILFKVGPGSFSPVPKVDSSVVRLDVLDEPAAKCRDYARLERLVSAAFSQRRKTLKNALKSSRLFSDDAIKAMADSGIDPSRRAETLSVAEFARLSDFLADFSFDFPMG